MQAEEGGSKQLEGGLAAILLGGTGQGQFQECEFEQVDKQQEDEEGNEFEMEEVASDEQVPTIKTAPFNASINLGPAERPPISNKAPNLEVKGVSFVFGLNASRSVVVSIDGEVCRAAGTTLVYKGMVYHSHFQQISHLHYDRKKRLLCSGGQGKSAEVIEWEVQDNKLKVIKKWHYPLKNLPPAFFCYQGDRLLSISSFSLHQSSHLFIFDKQSQKRSQSAVKLGKVMGLITDSEGVYVLNDTGLHRLEEQDNEWKTSCIVQKGFTSSCVSLQQKQDFLLGLFNGQVAPVIAGQLQEQKCVKLHEGLVHSLQYHKEGSLVVSAGGWDKKILLSKYDPATYTLQLQKAVAVDNPCKDILLEYPQMWLPLKSGHLLSYRFNQYSQLVNETPQVELAMTIPQQSKQSIKTFLAYNSENEDFVYGSSNISSVSVFCFSVEGKITDPVSVGIQQKPQTLAAWGDLVAYTYQEPVSKTAQASSMFKSNLAASKIVTAFFSKIKMIQPNKQELFIHNYKQNKPLCSLDLGRQHEVTCLSFSPSGDRLAVGFSDGVIVLYDCVTPTEVTKVCESPQKGKRHNSPVTQLVWSEEGNQLSSISSDNLLYYQTGFNQAQQKEELVLTRNVKESQWVQLPRFGWKTAKIWSRANTVGEFCSMNQTYNSIFVVTEEGRLKAYRNPAGLVHQDLGTWFGGSFGCRVFETQTSIYVSMHKRGVLLCVEVVDHDMEQGEQDQQ